MTSVDFQPGADFFDSLMPSADPGASRTLTIGPIAARLEEIPQHLLTPLDDHFLGFVDAEEQPRSLHLPVRRAGVARFLDPHLDIRRTCVQRADEDRIYLYGHYFAAWFERAGSQGMMALCRAGWMGLRVPLEIFLRVYCAWKAIERDGFLLHAASIVRDGRTYIFFGHSGAGKTTVSKFSRELGLILSDDITLVTHEAGGYRAHSVPFRAFEKSRVVAERRTYPVAGLFQLVQAKRNRVDRLPTARAVAAVLSCLPFVTEKLLPHDPPQMMALTKRILSEIPVFRLEFTRSAEFWKPVLVSGS